MRKRARTGLFDKLLSKVLIWFAGKAIESLPVIGPILKVIKLINDITEVSRACASA
jgi:hypothetical protein